MTDPKTLPLETPPCAPFRILCIAAHPDDIEFGVSGSVAVWTDAGAEVTYCIVTDGSAGGNAIDVNTAALVTQRQEEQRQSAARVGVRDIIFLGYRDGMLQPTLELRRDLTRVIRRVRPDRVVIMDPTTVLISGEGFDYINHPDHRAAGEAALYAIFPSAETRPIFPELLLEGLEPHHVNEVYLMTTDKANLAVDITTSIERKVQALLAHRSQVDDSAGEMVRGWAAETGRRCGVPFAEEFRVMRFYRGTVGLPQSETAAAVPADS
ncbi:MAG: PIG-L deacetylase family protein [Candidatus Flexifilum sp.]